MSERSINENGLGDGALHVQLDDEQYAALVDTAAGEKVIGLALWEESITDQFDSRRPQGSGRFSAIKEGGKPTPAARVLFDLELYLENNLLLTLYGTSFFPDPESDPLRGWQWAGKILQSLINEGIWLDEIAATEEDELVLILSRNHTPQMYLNVSGWSVEEWETLPGEQ